MNRTRTWMVVCVSALAGAMQLAAQPAAKPAARPAGIPAAAVKTDDGYRYTDSEGRQWIYRPTPFGISKAPATDVSAAKAEPPADEHIRAIDHGATVSFERPGPFGMYRWERKKTELDASERAALARASAAITDRK